MICFQLNILYRWVRLKMYVAFTSVHVHVLYKKKTTTETNAYLSDNLTKNTTTQWVL